MKRINTTTRNLLLILTAALTNCLIDGTMNLIVTICLCLALIPTARRIHGLQNFTERLPSGFKSRSRTNDKNEQSWL